MTLSVTYAGNPHGGKKGEGDGEDLAILVDKRLAESNNSVATLTDRVDNIAKHFKELESTGDFEELRGEVQATVNSTMADVDKKVLTL